MRIYEEGRGKCPKWGPILQTLAYLKTSRLNLCPEAQSATNVQQHSCSDRAHTQSLPEALNSWTFFPSYRDFNCHPKGVWSLNKGSLLEALNPKPLSGAQFQQHIPRRPWKANTKRLRLTGCYASYYIEPNTTSPTRSYPAQIRTK